MKDLGTSNSELSERVTGEQPLRPVLEPAFPRPGIHPGMSLRDWFAGQALPTFAGRNPLDAARAAYAIADAMLAERGK